MSPFAFPNYRFFWLARLTAMTAASAMMLIIGWQVYNLARLTMSPAEAAAQLGLVGLIQFVPLFALTPVTGWVADRVDRRWIARLTIALQLACAATLGLLTHADAMSLPALFAVAALLGVARAFAGPALSALGPNLVPKALLPKAIALTTLAWQVGQIVGPALAGFLYAWRGPAAYGLSAALLAVALFALLMIGPVPRPEGRPQPSPHSPDDRRAWLRPHQSPGAGRDHARSVRGFPRRINRFAADLRARHPQGRGGGPRASSAPRRPSGPRSPPSSSRSGR
jgi:MFS family permease